MAEENQSRAADASPAKEVVVTENVVEAADPVKSVAPEPDEDPKKPVQEKAPADEAETMATEEEMKKPAASKDATAGGVTLAVAFKEEGSLSSDLPEFEKEALDELKQLLHSALANREFSPPPLPPSETVPAAPAAGSAEEKAEEVRVPLEETAQKHPAETEGEKGLPVEDDDAKTVEAIAETVVPVAPAPVAVEEKALVGPPPPTEEVLIWGVPLLGDERSDTVLLKFLRARDFKVKDALIMIKNAVSWRKEFGVDKLLEEDLGLPELEKVVFVSGVDRDGHPVCYNAYGEFQNKELYEKAFGDEENQKRFLRWRIQYLEKGIRHLLDFKPGGISAMVQVTDLKNSPGPLKKEFRQALYLLLDNYPEFAAKQVFINVPWWYLAFNRMISPFLTQRTKGKFVFAGPSKSPETLFRFIAPEQVPVQFGGMKGENDSNFAVTDAAYVTNIKPSTKQIIEISVQEPCTVVWELRVLGWNVTFGAEFMPSSKDGYTVIVEKTRKMAAGAEPAVLKNCFKVSELGKVILTVDNCSSKRKMLLYRYKLMKSSEIS
ncbi:Patellin-5 [Apostasia shenzhenica]|uniref:Patellin-5 n=1 Tax=Apostasia shenzhenica TaxID=1088818 RepID=A0A2I0ANF9_9ASPA|nr:Patellin-5 [Apostasia shenzhenica]